MEDMTTGQQNLQREASDYLILSWCGQLSPCISGGGVEMSDDVTDKTPGLKQLRAQ